MRMDVTDCEVLSPISGVITCLVTQDKLPALFLSNQERRPAAIRRSLHRDLSVTFQQSKMLVIRFFLD